MSVCEFFNKYNGGLIVKGRNFLIVVVAGALLLTSVNAVAGLFDEYYLAYVTKVRGITTEQSVEKFKYMGDCEAAIVKHEKIIRRKGFNDTYVVCRPTLYKRLKSL